MPDPIRFGRWWVHMFPSDAPPCEVCGQKVRDHTEVWIDQSGAVVQCSNQPKEGGSGRPGR